MSSTQAGQVSKFAPVKHVLKTPKYLLIIAGTGIAYALIYMLVVGVISYYPNWEADWSTMNFPIVRSSSLGITIIPYNHVFIFIFYSAIAFITISSFLVGLNVSLLVYSRKMGRSCGINAKSVGPRSFFGLLPAFFTSFACCSGGVLTLVMGATAFGSLSLFSQYMAPVTVAALAAGTYFASKRISTSCIQK